MRNATILFALGLLVVLATALPAQGQQVEDRRKLAQTGMKFLSVTTDPRAAALADAATALESGSAALFANPAGMAGFDGFVSVSAAQLQWIADINYNRASLALRPAGGRWGVFGVTFLAVDYGDLQATIRADNDDGFEDLGYSFAPTALAVGVGYARALTDRFSVGAHVKYAHQDLGEAVMSLGDEGGMTMAGSALGVFAYDFGVLYRTGFRSLTFAVTARNFAQEIAYEEESFQLPLTLRIGLAMNVLDFTAMDPAMHALTVSVEAETPRDYEEQVKVGGEYAFMDTFVLRAGYAYPSDVFGPSLGLGIRQGLAGVGAAIDYAYTDAGVFNQFARVHRVALQLSF